MIDAQKNSWTVWVIWNDKLTNKLTRKVNLHLTLILTAGGLGVFFTNLR